LGGINFFWALGLF